MPQARKATQPATADDQTDDPVIATARGSTSDVGQLPYTRRVTLTGDVEIGRTDDDALTNRFATIIAGEHAGRYVVVGSSLEMGSDGYPLRVLVRTRDDRDEVLTVDYADLRPTATGGRV